MSTADPYNDLPPPPPAYLEADFDRKVSSAMELSLHTPQPQHDEAWESWDDEVFAAAQASVPSKHYPRHEKQNPYLPSQGASSHFTPAGLPYRPVEPLKISKKIVDANTSKPPPSWLNSIPHHAGSVNRDASARSYSNDQLPAHHDDSAMHPPPAFTSHGPSLDGPPYEQVVNHSWTGNRSSGPSPHHRAALPQTPRTQQHTTQRHVSQYPSHRLMPTPISTFDPSMAYHQDSNLRFAQQPVQNHDEDYIPDFGSLYNSVVANHLTTAPKHTQRSRVSSNHHLAPSQPTREIFPNHLSPVRAGQVPPPSGMAPAQNPAAPRFSAYSPYHHAAMSGLRNERQVACYRPGDG